MNLQFLTLVFMLKIIADTESIKLTNARSDVFKPKESIEQPIDDIEEDNSEAANDENDSLPSGSIDFSIKKFPNLESYYHFILSNSVLKPTSINENTIELVTDSQFPFEFVNILLEKNLKSNNTWRLNGNVCNSKTIYLKQLGEYHDYSFKAKCEQKVDGENCLISIVTGFKNYTIQIVTFCCPNFRLNQNSCVKIENSNNFLEELKLNLNLINTTVNDYLQLAESDFQSDIIQNYMDIFDHIYDKINMDSGDKLTVFLWDNEKLMDKINQYFNRDDLELEELLDKILSLIKHHIVDFHHPIQSIYFDGEQVEPLAQKKYKFTQFKWKNKTHLFLECYELIETNNYYKNGRLLIHKLENGSLLVPRELTIYEVLENKILETTNNFKIFKSLFNEYSFLFFEQFNSLDSYTTLFIPTDYAYQNFTKSEIDSIKSDIYCTTQLIERNFFDQNICLNQIIKLNAQYQIKKEIIVEDFYQNQIRTYRPWFKIAEKNKKKFLYFNRQYVHLSRSSPALNGIVHAISNLNMNEIKLLENLVGEFEKKISPSFINALGAQWKNVIRNNSNDIFLILPGMKYSDNHHLNLSIKIEDYLFKKKFNLYELDNGHILTSLNNKSYLINSFKTSQKTFEDFKYLPSKYFYSKFINCQKFEEQQYSGCNSELAFYNSRLNYVPELNSKSLNEFILNDIRFDNFRNLLNACGKKCMHIFNNIEQEAKPENGFTLFLPIEKIKVKDFSVYIKSKIFKGTLCDSLLESESIRFENLLNEKLDSKEVYKLIKKPQVYLSIKGILVHLI